MTPLVLAMALCIAPGNTSGGISTEVREGLDLIGIWEGTLAMTGQSIPCTLVNGRAITLGAQPGKLQSFEVRDEGSNWVTINGCMRGRFRCSGNRVTICFGDPSAWRPKDFKVTNTQHLLILRRVK